MLHQQALWGRQTRATGGWYWYIGTGINTLTLTHVPRAGKYGNGYDKCTYGESSIWSQALAVIVCFQCRCWTTGHCGTYFISFGKSYSEIYHLENSIALPRINNSSGMIYSSSARSSCSPTVGSNPRQLGHITKRSDCSTGLMGTCWRGHYGKDTAHQHNTE